MLHINLISYFIVCFQGTNNFILFKHIKLEGPINSGLRKSGQDTACQRKLIHSVNQENDDCR